MSTRSYGPDGRSNSPCRRAQPIRFAQRIYALSISTRKSRVRAFRHCPWEDFSCDLSGACSLGRSRYPTTIRCDRYIPYVSHIQVSRVWRTADLSRGAPCIPGSSHLAHLSLTDAKDLQHLEANERLRQREHRQCVAIIFEKRCS